MKNLDQLSGTDIRNLVATRQTATPLTWVGIDRFLNKRSIAHKKLNEEWQKLPRVEMVEGGVALEEGLKLYQAFLDRHFSISQQQAMLVEVVLEAREQQTSAHSISVGPREAHWLEVVASREGLGITQYVGRLIAHCVNGERNKARQGLM